MKKLALAAAMSLTASTAFAGSLADPVVEPIIEEPVIVEETTSSAGGILVPLIFLVLVAAAIASD